MHHQRIDVDLRQLRKGVHQPADRHDSLRDRLDELSFEQKRDVLEALQAQFTLEKDGSLRIVLVLPTAADISLYTTLRRASA